MPQVIFGCCWFEPYVLPFLFHQTISSDTLTRVNWPEALCRGHALQSLATRKYNSAIWCASQNVVGLIWKSNKTAHEWLCWLHMSIHMMTPEVFNRSFRINTSKIELNHDCLHCVYRKDSLTIPHDILETDMFTPSRFCQFMYTAHAWFQLQWMCAKYQCLPAWNIALWQYPSHKEPRSHS